MDIWVSFLISGFYLIRIDINMIRMRCRENLNADQNTQIIKFHDSVTGYFINFNIILIFKRFKQADIV